MRGLLGAMLLALVAAAWAQQSNTTCENGNVGDGFYQYSAVTLQGDKIDFSDYEGKVILATNVASFWGLTVTNYHENNALYQMFHDDGLEILAFACNQFGYQETAKNTEIMDCLEHVRPGGGYTPLFPIFEKSDVNGRNANGPFKWLKDQCGPATSEIAHLKIIGGAEVFISWNPVEYNDITWNFEKFLLDRNGKVYKRYTPQTPPMALLEDIEFLLNGGSA